MPADSQLLLARLDGLRTELADLAYELEGRGRLDAADVVNSIAARMDEIQDEFAAGDLPSPAIGLKS